MLILAFKKISELIVETPGAISMGHHKKVGNFYGQGTGNAPSGSWKTVFIGWIFEYDGIFCPEKRAHRDSEDPCTAQYSYDRYNLENRISHSQAEVVASGR